MFSPVSILINRNYGACSDMGEVAQQTAATATFSNPHWPKYVFKFSHFNANAVFSGLQAWTKSLVPFLTT